MAAAIGRRCVQISGSIPKRLTDGSKVVLKSGDPTLVAGARLLRKSRWMPFCGMIEEDQGNNTESVKGKGFLADFQLNVAISTIHNYLEEQLLTLKKVHYIAADANNAKKQGSARGMCKQSVPICRTRQLSGWTKTNVNLYCRRTQGRAPAGQRAAVTLPGSKGPNVHVIGAITNFQVVKWSRPLRCISVAKPRRTGLLICYSISHKVIIQLTCALMQRCTPIFIL